MPVARKAEPSTTTRVSKAALAAAGQRATLKAIDYGWDLRRQMSWRSGWGVRRPPCPRYHSTGGKCELVNSLHVGSMRRPGLAIWATISLVHPKERDDKPLIEIFLEKPDHGHSGVAFAFRSLMITRDNGTDYLRFRKEFEAEDERFPRYPTAFCCQSIMTPTRSRRSWLAQGDPRQVRSAGAAVPSVAADRASAITAMRGVC
jgi:hypothetical protein